MIQVRSTSGSGLYYVKGVLLRMKRKISLLSLLLVAALVLGMVPFGAFRTEAYAATTDGDGTTAGEEASFDVQGSKEATPTELDPTQRETTVTLQLPAGEYKNKIDIVFTMDSSSSAKNSKVFETCVNDLFNSILENNPGVELKVGVIRFRGRAHDAIAFKSKDKYKELVPYNNDTKGFINDALNMTETEIKENFGNGSSTHGGMDIADEWLAADTEVPNSHKYVVLLTDGKTYIWNNEDNEPTTINLQHYRDLKVPAPTATNPNATKTLRWGIQNGGLPDVNQSGGTRKGDYPVDVLDKSGNSNIFWFDDYQELYNSTSEELTDVSPWDVVCRYADDGSKPTGTVIQHEVTNGAALFGSTSATYGDKNHYQYYWEYIPDTAWKNVPYLEANPFVVIKNNDGTYTFDTTQINPNYYMYHTDALLKGMYMAGHLWTEMNSKYNCATITYSGGGATGFVDLRKSFIAWLQKNSRYGADIMATENIKTLFENIDNSIRYTVAKGIVTDQITDDFTLRNAVNADGFRMTWNKKALAVAFVDGKWNFGEIGNDGKYPYVVSYDESKKTITWEINVPVENLKPVTLSYDLEIDEAAETGKYDTNVSAILDYKSTDGKRDGSYPFPVPKVNYKATAEYYVKHLELGTNIPVYDEEHGSAVVGSMVTAAAINIPDDGWALAPDQPESQDLLITSVAANNVITFLYTVQNSSYVTLHYDATQYKPQATEEENNKAIIKKVIDPKEVQVGTYVTGSAIRLPEYPTKDGIFYVYTESPYEADGCTIKENKDQNVLRFFYNPIIVTINHWLEDYTASASGNAAGSSSSLKGNADLAIAATTADASKYVLYTTTTASDKLGVEYVAEKLNPIPSGYHFDQAVTNDLGQEKGVITEKGLELNLYYSKDQAPTPRPNPNPNPNPNPDPDPSDEPEPIEDPDTPLAPSETEDTEIDDGDTPLAPSETEDTEIDEEATPLSPFTGDSRHTVVWAGISVAALLGIIFLGKKRKING